MFWVSFICGAIWSSIVWSIVALYIYRKKHQAIKLNLTMGAPREK